jgi:hypothetical protein
MVLLFVVFTALMLGTIAITTEIQKVRNEKRFREADRRAVMGFDFSASRASCEAKRAFFNEGRGFNSRFRGADAKAAEVAVHLRSAVSGSQGQSSQLLRLGR